MQPDYEIKNNRRKKRKHTNTNVTGTWCKRSTKGIEGMNDLRIINEQQRTTSEVVLRGK